MNHFSYFLIGLICLVIIIGVLVEVYYFQPEAQKEYDNAVKQLNELKTCQQLQLYDKNISYIDSNEYARIALHEKVIEKSKEVCK